MTKFNALKLLKHAHSASTILNPQFKKTMGSIASQVMILTSSHQLPQHLNSNKQHRINQSSNFKGVTLSSCVSLSMDPSPLLQFNLKVPSLTSDNLHKMEIMALHILTPTNQSANLARNFSRNGKIVDGKFQPHSPFDQLTFGKDYEFYEGIHNGILPILKNVKNVMICKKLKCLKVQDHEIWIVKVVDIIEGEEEGKEGGLLNFNRRFLSIDGDEVE